MIEIRVVELSLCHSNCVVISCVVIVILFVFEWVVVGTQGPGSKAGCKEGTGWGERTVHGRGGCGASRSDQFPRRERLSSRG